MLLCTKRVSDFLARFGEQGRRRLRCLWLGGRGGATSARLCCCGAAAGGPCCGTFAPRAWATMACAAGQPAAFLCMVYRPLFPIYLFENAAVPLLRTCRTALHRLP